MIFRIKQKHLDGFKRSVMQRKNLLMVVQHFQAKAQRKL
jgi:hypothetical protein